MAPKPAQYQYNGLGFPLTLYNVPLRNFRGALVPDLDYNALQLFAIKELKQKASPLTGHELRFIRQYLRMTPVQFAASFEISLSDLLAWEKAENSPAYISPSVEVLIKQKLA